MTANLVFLIVVGALFACGAALLLERSLSRVVMGLVMLGNGVNLLILSAGRPGGPPIVGATPADEMSDPLSEALVLTAIVITFGVTAFLLAMAYRSWQVTGHDEVQDDVEDRRIVRRASSDEALGADEEAGDDELSSLDPARLALRRGHERGD